MSYWKPKVNVEYLSRPPSETERNAAESTSRQIREAIQREQTLRGRNLDIFLQGSYANSTNISGGSDVDVVAKLEDVFYHDFLDGVKEETKTIIKESIIPAQYSYEQYRADLLAALRSSFPNSVIDGNKAITVRGTASGSRLDADVIPCATFHMYQENHSYQEGICFWPKGQYSRIVNFPKQHRENMSNKNSQYRAGPKFKGLIRAMKRLRNQADPLGHELCKIAASYWIECLMYNVPDDRFAGSHSDALLSCLSYLYNKVEETPDQFAQANEVYLLFHPKFWDPAKAKKLVDTVWDQAYELVNE